MMTCRRLLMLSYPTLFLFLSLICRTDASFVVGRTHLHNTATSSTSYTQRSVDWRWSASTSPNADPNNNSDKNHNVNNNNNISVETEKKKVEWGISYIGGDPCGSKYNNDPFDDQVQKPGMPDDMKERIQLLAERKKNEFLAQITPPDNE